MKSSDAEQLCHLTMIEFVCQIDHFENIIKKNGDVKPVSTKAQFYIPPALMLNLDDLSFSYWVLRVTCPRVDCIGRPVDMFSQIVQQNLSHSIMRQGNGSFSPTRHARPISVSFIS